ncbi:MAG: hypothetical protein ABI806_11325 [Candidatus Solibacter sp.]
MRAWLGLVVAGIAAAQSVAPEVLLLARVKAHTREELARLPNCSCLETVRREYKDQGAADLEPRDVLRLEVLYSDGREYYASPAESQFTQSHPSSFAAGGTIGNGHFALFLHEIASERGPSYEYKGVERLLGRELARWDYRVALQGSGHVLNMGGGDSTVGMTGSFWADPATYEIVRIQMAANEIPPTLLVQSSETWIEYAHTNLGGREYLLPQSAEARLTKFTGEDSRNHLEFTHCRLFTAHSAISFGATPEDHAAKDGPVRDFRRELPPGLAVTIKIHTAITGDLAVGTLLEGTVEGNVSYKKQVVVPGGSVVRGRVRRLEDRSGTFAISLEFTDVEAGEMRYRFFADLQSVEGVTGPRRAGILASEPGVGSFVVEGPRLDLAAGFRMTWKTRTVAE